MNAAQRKYLIDEIKKSAKIQVDTLRESKPDAPNLSNYLLHAVMSGNFELQPIEVIRQTIIDKALKSKAGESNWLGEERWNSSSAKVQFKPGQIFVIPEEYKRLDNEYWGRVKEIDDEINAILQKEKGLVTRITLASDKTLQRMINEVDDMGDLSLVDDSLKLLLERGKD